jgi:hypothetical protein
MTKTSASPTKAAPQVAEVDSVASTEAAAEQQPEEPSIRVLKAAACPSLSGKSRLTYEIGCSADNALQLRLTKNSGSGMFSKAWLPMEQLHALLQKNGGKPISFATLLPLFKGGSINTAGFVLAVLKHEGLVQAGGEKIRTYTLGDPARFFAEVQALMGAVPEPKKSGAKRPAKAAKPAKVAT